MSENSNQENMYAVKAKGFFQNLWPNFKSVFTYEGLIQNAYYLVMVFLFCIIYIANSNKFISLIKEINTKSTALKEVNWRYKDVQSRLMYQTSENQISDRAIQLGLKSLDKPAFEIYKEPLDTNTTK